MTMADGDGGIVSVRKQGSLSHPVSSSDKHSDATDDNHDHPRRTTTNCWDSFQPGSISNLCSATLGAGALSLPFAISLTGIVVGIILLLVSASLTIISVDVIIDACVRTQLFKYEDVAKKLVGRHAGRLLEVSLLIFCIGTAVAYIVAVGDILFEGIEAIGLSTTNYSRQRIMISFWVSVMFPLSLQRHMDALERFSSLGVLSILSLVFATVIHSISHSKTFGGNENTQKQYPIDVMSILWPDSFWNIVKACPIFIFAFSCQINVCAIYEELSPISKTSGAPVSLLKSKQQVMKRITRNSVLLCLSLYICIGLFGFLEFGNQTSDNILNNYCMQDTHDPMIIVPSAFFAVAIVVAYPFNIFPARVTLKLILDRWRKRRRCGRCHRFLSSLTCTNCLLPCPGSSEYSRIGSADAIVTDPLLGDYRFGDRPVLIPHMSLESSAIDNEEESSIESPSAEHFLLTLILSGSSLVIALLIPGMSTIFGIMGGSAASFIGFILPGMFMKAETSLSPGGTYVNPSIRGMSFFLIWGGILIGILSTSITFYDVFTQDESATINICGPRNATVSNYQVE